jgi:hypothetical protein
LKKIISHGHIVPPRKWNNNLDRRLLAHCCTPAILIHFLKATIQYLDSPACAAFRAGPVE